MYGSSSGIAGRTRLGAASREVAGKIGQPSSSYTGLNNKSSYSRDESGPTTSATSSYSQMQKSLKQRALEKQQELEKEQASNKYQDPFTSSIS